MFSITLGDYTLTISEDMPSIYNEYHKRAQLVEFFESEDTKDAQFFLAVARGSNWPFLMVVQHYRPGPENAFYPGVVLIAETGLLFIGAGQRIVAYSLEPLRRLWEEEVMVGFWGWERYHECIIMSAEIELAVWNIQGVKQWSVVVEPPWNYTIEGDTLYVEVMGKLSSFSLQHGPTRAL